MRAAVVLPVGLSVLLAPWPVRAWTAPTPADCATHDSSLLQVFDAGVKLADDVLLQSGDFARVVHGVAWVIANSSQGEDDGGGTNTDGSYITYSFKASEVFPDGECDTLTTINGESVCTLNRARTSWLGPADAIVFTGCTPPPVAYFGFDMQVISRFDDQGYQYFPGQCFGDALGHTKFNHTAGQGPFNSPTVVVQTADQGTGQTVLEAYRTAGFDSDTFNVFQVNSEEVVLDNRSMGSWRVSRPDLLSTVLRVTLPLIGTEDEFVQYGAQHWPVRLYLAADDKQPTAPFAPALTSRYGAKNEIDLFSDVMQELEQAVVARFVDGGARLAGAVPQYFTSRGFYDDWDSCCLNNVSNATGFIVPTRDAVYGFPVGGVSGIANTSAAAVVVGVLHTHENALNVSYTSVGMDVVNLQSQITFSKWFNHVDMAGSAARYLPGHPDADKLFALDFLPQGSCAKDAWTSDWCVEFNESATSSLVNIMLLGSRVYLDPDTGTGPAANQTMPARTLSFFFD